MIFQKHVWQPLAGALFFLMCSMALPGNWWPARGETAWQLWRGNTLLGAVAVRETSEGALVALDALGTAAGYAGAPGEETYVLEQPGKRVEFVAQAPVARVNGRIYPLASPVSQEGERWWADARAALVVLNGAEGTRGARGLRWGGVAEEQPLPSAQETPSVPEGPPTPETPPMPETPPVPEDVAVAAGLVQVQRLRWGRQPESIRVVFDLSGAPAVTLEEKPQGLVVTLEGVLPRQAEGTSSPFAGTVDLALAQMGPRLVCTFSHRARAVKSLVLKDPHRLMIDFLDGEGPSAAERPEPVVPAERPVDGREPGAAAEELRIPSSVAEELALPESGGEDSPPPPEVPSPPPTAELRKTVLPEVKLPPAGEDEAPPPSSERSPRPRKGKGLVLVDAGHGGKDPGAQGNGLREKDLNLKVAMNLAGRLKSMGFDVRLTRATDVYLKLKERTDIANTEDADLFISIHTNALPKGRHARGVEIYIMALPTDKDAMELALFENRELAEDASTSHAVANKRTQLLLKILGDMQQNAKISDSMEFAETLFSSGKRQGLNMRRIAQAPFFVLRGAGMPAVLLEMGYITESSEAKMLRTQAFQDRMAAALADGAAAFLNR